MAQIASEIVIIILTKQPQFVKKIVIGNTFQVVNIPNLTGNQNNTAIFAPIAFAADVC